MNPVRSINTDQVKEDNNRLSNIVEAGELARNIQIEEDFIAKETTSYESMLRNKRNRIGDLRVRLDEVLANI